MIFAVSQSVFKTSNFAPAFYVLPSRPRRALKAVYAFCRTVDDVVDLGERDPANAQKTLEAWRGLLRNPDAARPGGLTDPGVWAALRDALAAYPIDPKHLLDLVDGVGRDLTQKRYDTFEDLKTYCYGVASTVGLACLPIFGLDEGSHRDFAVSLGLAVQLTNILRDVKTDAARGRVYLPGEDLKRFNYTEAELTGSVYNPAFARLMGFEARRAEAFFLQARAALPGISRRAARPALVMGALYQRLLKRLEERRFDVFSRRPALGAADKIRCVAKVVWEEWGRDPRPGR